MALGSGIDCHVAERFQKIVLAIFAATSGRASLLLVRVHGGSGSSGTPHSRVPLWPHAPLKESVMILFAVVCIPITAFRSLHRFSSDPPLVLVVCSGEYLCETFHLRPADETHWALNYSDGNALHSVASGGLETR